MAEALAAVYVAGHRSTSPRCIIGGAAVRTADLSVPRRRFWPKSSDFRGIDGQGAAGSGILGSVKDLALATRRCRRSVKSQPWLSHHVIYGTIVVPGRDVRGAALAASGRRRRCAMSSSTKLIILGDKASREVQLTVHPVEERRLDLPGTQPPLR